MPPVQPWEIPRVLTKSETAELSFVQKEIAFAGGRMDMWDAGAKKPYKTIAGFALPPLCTRTTGPAEKIKGA